MKKRICALLLALSCLAVFAGCGSGVKLSTDIGEFEVLGVKFYDHYGDSLSAQSGEKLMVVVLKAGEDFDETQFKSYFCPDEENAAKTIARVNGSNYTCQAVAAQGTNSSSKVQHTLVFSVPASAEDAEGIELQAPNQDFIKIN